MEGDKLKKYLILTLLISFILIPTLSNAWVIEGQTDDFNWITGKQIIYYGNETITSVKLVYFTNENPLPLYQTPVDFNQTKFNYTIKPNMVFENQTYLYRAEIKTENNQTYILYGSFSTPNISTSVYFDSFYNLLNISLNSWLEQGLSQNVIDSLIVAVENMDFTNEQVQTLKTFIEESIENNLENQEAELEREFNRGKGEVFFFFGLPICGILVAICLVLTRRNNLTWKGYTYLGLIGAFIGIYIFFYLVIPTQMAYVLLIAFVFALIGIIIEFKIQDGEKEFKLKKSKETTDGEDW